MAEAREARIPIKRPCDRLTINFKKKRKKRRKKERNKGGERERERGGEKTARYVTRHLPSERKQKSY